MFTYNSMGFSLIRPTNISTSIRLHLWWYKPINVIKYIYLQLIRQLPNLNEKCKELPLSRMYSVKARAILHAHLGRIPLNPDTLDKDRQLIVQKCPYLIHEMVSCVNQLIMLAYARRSK